MECDFCHCVKSDVETVDSPHSLFLLCQSCYDQEVKIQTMLKISCPEIFCDCEECDEACSNENCEGKS